MPRTDNLKKKLLKIIDTIKGSGDYITDGKTAGIIPGLTIKGLGEVSFPIQDEQIKKMLKLSHFASFGQGAETKLDPSIRKVKEIDADQIEFCNEKWKVCIDNIVAQVKKGFGLEEQSIKASLYKLLIYEAGGFFVSHKDSEKEKGMFATLIINIPSKHRGGELVVRFDGKEEIIDFSESSAYEMPFVAFYADSEHEIRPLKSGNRICLVYNLLFSKGCEVASPKYREQSEQISNILQKLDKNDTQQFPKAMFLEHEYTPVNFKLSNLKQHDFPRAKAFLNAAEKAGYFAKLGLVTHYKMGELESDDYDYSGRGRGRGRDDLVDSSMGEIYEQYTTIENWDKGIIPDLGELQISESNMIANVKVGTGIPTEEESEGYTGNAGMTMEYWYHYAAIIFWPKNIHIALLSKTDISVVLKWLKYFVRSHCGSKEENSHYIKAILIDLVSKELEEEFLDFSIIAQALAKINDRNFVVEHGLTILFKVFDKVNVSHWLKVLKVHQDIDFSSLFLKVGNSNNISMINHLIKILQFIKNKKKLNKFQLASLNINSEIENLGQSLLGLEIDQLNKNSNRYHYSYSDQPSRKKLIIELVSQLLEISQEKIISDKWEDAVVACITSRLPREFTNQVLITNLLICKVKNSFFKKLYEKCYADLDLRVKNKPKPLPDWRREVPNIKSGVNVWELLKLFLNSRTQKTFEYKKAMADRSEVENVIHNTTIDLEMKTIRIGSPHTLVIEKNNASYERKKDMWNEDVELLIKLKRLV